jgi:hypothetical protein
MEICDNGHAGIVHTEKECPMCDVSKEMEEFKGDIDSISDDLYRLGESISAKLDTDIRIAGGFNPEDTMSPEYLRIARLHPLFSAVYIESIEERIRGIITKIARIGPEL